LAQKALVLPKPDPYVGLGVKKVSASNLSACEGVVVVPYCVHYLANSNGTLMAYRHRITLALHPNQAPEYLNVL